MLTLVVAWGFARYERRLRARTFQAEVEAIGQRIQTRIETHAHALVSLAARWAGHPRPTRDCWLAESRLTLRQSPGFQAVAWVDPASCVRWATSLDGNQGAVSLQLGSDPRRRRAAEMARATRQPHLSRPLELVQGGQAFFLLAPMFRGEQFEGVVLGVFRSQSLLNRILPHNLDRAYCLLIQDGEETVFRGGESPQPASARWVQRAEIQLPGGRWELKGWPTAERLSREQSPVPRLALAGGLLLSGLVTVLIHWRGGVAARAREAREAARGLITASAQRELRQLAAALENAVEGIAYLDLHGSFTAANQAYAGALGRTPGEMLGMPWLETVHPEDRGRLREIFQQVREAGKAECEARGLRRDGTVFAMQAVMLAHGGPDGQPDGHYCFMRDITARKRAEEALRESNARLEASNQDLADFAAAASHDMQEPLRKIQAFSDLLKLSYATALDEQGRQYLDRMYSAAERMRTLVRDLLTLSRVTKAPPAPELVDLAAVARDVVGDLELRIQAVGGRVEIGELPPVLADPTQMRQLLQNLIGNALKFHRKETPPEVVVTGTRQEGGWCEVVVRDNGIGFEEQYAEAVFAPFRRLHGRGEYDGTGLGLSVCRRIVERHGGAISARSRPGYGSTFVVTLPAAPGAVAATPDRSAA